MARTGRIRHALPETRWPSAEEASLARLFQPIALPCGLRLAQRTWVPAMVPWRATVEGEVTPALVAWYGRFAEGEPGAIVVEATGIRGVPSGPLLRIGEDRFVEGLRGIVEEIHRRSAGRTKALIQLIDFLRIRRRPEASRFFREFLEIRTAHREALAELSGEESVLTLSEEALRRRLEASSEAELVKVLTARELEALHFGARERVTDLHLDEIRDLPRSLPDLFARAALRAEAAGFDGVELHYAHAYTMASFLSRTNDRDDGYGGSREGRVRLPVEVFRAVRSMVRPTTAVGCRLLGDEVIAGGSGIEDASFYAAELARAGMDFISVSKGGKFEDAKQPKVGHASYPYTGPSGHECMPTVYSDERGPFGRNLPLAAAIRAAVRAAGCSTPIVAAGGINTFELAEAALERGDADVIASARGCLADPDWFRKARLGRGQEVRRCQLTNYCEGLDQQHREVSCRLWDRLQGEPRSSDRKRLLIAPSWEE